MVRIGTRRSHVDTRPATHTSALSDCSSSIYGLKLWQLEICSLGQVDLKIKLETGGQVWSPPPFRVLPTLEILLRHVWLSYLNSIIGTGQIQPIVAPCDGRMQFLLPTTAVSTPPNPSPTNPKQMPVSFVRAICLCMTMHEKPHPERHRFMLGCDSADAFWSRMETYRRDMLDLRNIARGLCRLRDWTEEILSIHTCSSITSTRTS